MDTVLKEHIYQLESQNDPVFIEHLRVLNEIFKVGSKVTITSGEYKGKTGTVRDVEGDEVQLKVNGKIVFVNSKDLER